VWSIGILTVDRWSCSGWNKLMRRERIYLNNRVLESRFGNQVVLEDPIEGRCKRRTAAGTTPYK